MQFNVSSMIDEHVIPGDDDIFAGQDNGLLLRISDQVVCECPGTVIEQDLDVALGKDILHPGVSADQRVGRGLAWLGVLLLRLDEGGYQVISPDRLVIVPGHHVNASCHARWRRLPEVILVKLHVQLLARDHAIGRQDIDVTLEDDLLEDRGSRLMRRVRRTGRLPRSR